jgi:hypothetical protein
MGRVSFQKVDDMKRQVEARNSPLSTVGLLTDSCCDLPQELLDRYQVHTVPLTVSSGGWEYLDKLTLKPGEIYTALRETVSSCPSASATRRTTGPWIWPTPT